MYNLYNFTKRYTFIYLHLKVYSYSIAIIRLKLTAQGTHMEFEKIIKTLQQNSRFFNTFSDAEMMQILKHCTSKSYKEGQVVFQERSLGEQMYIVLTGAVRIKKQGKIIDLVRKGECFGEMGAVSGDERSATAEASSDVLLLEINEKKVESLPDELQVKLYKNIMLILSDRLRKRIEEKSH